ncbi:MAG: hemolysin family protein [Dermatophilaceae bacterium]|nr:hemolysin family protein [Intrasporangiaceae bacterium]
MRTLLITVALIAGSAFFVMVEFSLMASRRYRLEEAARTSRAGRAALRNASDLTLMLAGAQLGITLATLALGAFTKPAVKEFFTPVFSAVGLPPSGASAVSFVLALAIVTFLHLVVGEMAPKSFSLAHPERTAIVLALPMRGFLWLTRPVLYALNRAANWLVRRSGATPADELSTAQDAASLRHLVEHSANVGALAVHHHRGVVGALDFSETTLGEIAIPDEGIVWVPVEATVADVQAATVASGHLRILVMAGDRITGVVHVRDTMDADLAQEIDNFVRRVLVLDARTTVYEALARMQRQRTHVAVVTQGGTRLGMVTMQDVLPQVLPKARVFPDEATFA